MEEIDSWKKKAKWKVVGTMVIMKLLDRHIQGCPKGKVVRTVVIMELLDRTVQGWGWRKFSGKSFLHKREELSFDKQYLHESRVWQHALATPGLRYGNRQIPGAFWSVSLAETLNITLREESASKTKLESNRRRHPKSVSGLHMHSHRQACTHTYVCPPQKHRHAYAQINKCLGMEHDTRGEGVKLNGKIISFRKGRRKSIDWCGRRWFGLCLN